MWSNFFFFFFIQFRQLAHSLEFNDDESNLIWSGHEKIKLKPSCAKQYLKPIKEFKFPPFIQTLTTCSSAQKKKENIVSMVQLWWQNRWIFNCTTRCKICKLPKLLIKQTKWSDTPPFQDIRQRLELYLYNEYILKRHFVCQQPQFPKCYRVSLWRQRPEMQSCQWISQTNSSVMRLICCTDRSDPILLADGCWF